MKAQLGKPTGLALALLATLLATFLAMGVFSVAQAQTTSHSATRDISDTTVAPGSEVMVTIEVSGYVGNGLVEETLPAGFSWGTSNPAPVGTQGVVTLWAFQEGLATIEYTATAPSQPGTYDFMGTFIAGSPGVSVPIGGESTVTVAADPTNGGNGDGDGNGGGNWDRDRAEYLRARRCGPDHHHRTVLIQPFCPMSKSRWTCRASASPIPSLIPTSAFPAVGYRGNPSNVVVNGSTVTMTVPNVKANGDDQRLSVMGDYTIRIKQSAGITNAASGGDKTVAWQENAPGRRRERGHGEHQPRDQAEQDQRHSRHDDHRNLQGLRQRIGDSRPERRQARRGDDRGQQRDP